jgi:HEAT repeat protein
MAEGVKLLDDEAMARFIRDGYVTVRTELPQQFHEHLRRRVVEVMDREGNWGNNMLPRVPEMQQVWDDPAVRGALSSILGPTYATHPHRHCHLNEPGSQGQRLHFDTREFSGDTHLQQHRCRWAIAFYYPHDVTDDMGPTGIAPRTQYYHRPPDEREFPELLLSAPGGTVAIVNFDIWHRATPNRSTTRRLMIKFEFGRMDEPDGPSWESSREAWAPVDAEAAAPAPHNVVWSHLWRWMRGGTPGGTTFTSAGSGADAGRWLHLLEAGDVPARRRATDGLGMLGPAAREALPALVRALRDADEPVRLNAAYALGALGEPAVPAAADALRQGPEEARRAGGYALSAVGAPGVEALVAIARDADEPARIVALSALGDMGRDAAAAVPALTALLRDAAGTVRRNAADALGILGAAASPAVPALAAALGDEQPYVRINAATALARIGPAASQATEVVPALARALADPDRYVVGWAGLALRRIATPEAADVLLDHLMNARWCPQTTVDSRY